ncbi:MAG: acyl-CoA carboxylase subunit beta [Sphaerochaetaceae bacterium]|jgi:acetyl-CoA carboxylase carboxyltransferase component|nr:acyl-CoA carboxylase subunit beta [Sphaerochaetaceae bacterium]MDX9939692.1 acyl-CoA carboxylase subunit beta [Sphaerochaetaceae bacterium]
MDDRLGQMRNRSQEGGGEERVAAQHAKGKQTARERIAMLADPGSFIEYNPYMTSRAVEFGMERHRLPGDGVVTGTVLVDGRQVWVSSQDFTVLGGSLGEQQAEKIARVQELALQTGCPFIQINDSGGARIQEGVYSLDGYGKIFRNNILASGVIPQISLILGPCAGGAAYSPAITDFVYMVDGVSQMYITGPDVIKAVTGEDVTHEDLGGASAHARKSGNAHFHLADEASVFAHVRRLLAYLPANNRQPAPVEDTGAGTPQPTGKIGEILSGRATKAYDMHDVIDELFDAGSFLEVHKEYAPSILVGFARLEGRPVGIIANQPKFLSGTLDINSSDKGARFVRFCDAFNIPVISLVDVPGYMPGTNQEWNGIIRHGAKLLYAIGEATVPKIALIVRKAYGGAYIAMSSRTLGYDRVLSFPTAEVAVMGAEGAANIIFRKEIAGASDPVAVRGQKIEEFRENSMNPFVSAAGGMVDDVIAPGEARQALFRSLESLSGKRESRPQKKHGNIPL